jgi:hypothetical protein
MTSNIAEIDINYDLGSETINIWTDDDNPLKSAKEEK